jgi:hypothetical protein
MTGLRDAIVSSRQARMALRGDLIRQTDERRMRVSALCAGFAHDRAGAHWAWFGPALFKGRTAERSPQPGLVQALKANPPVGDQAPATTPKAEPRRHKPAHKPVAAAAPASVAPLRRAKRRSTKALKKH